MDCKINTSLYNLPKDIVIKILSIISEDTKKECKKVMGDELKDCKKKLEAYENYYGRSQIVECNYKNGNCYLAKYVHCDEQICDICSLSYCENHMYKKNLNCVCEECYDKAFPSLPTTKQ